MPDAVTVIGSLDMAQTRHCYFFAKECQDHSPRHTPTARTMPDAMAVIGSLDMAQMKHCYFGSEQSQQSKMVFFPLLVVTYEMVKNLYQENKQNAHNISKCADSRHIRVGKGILHQVRCSKAVQSLHWEGRKSPSTRVTFHTEGATTRLPSHRCTF